MNEAAGGADPEAPPPWRDHEGRAVVPHGFRSTFRDWAGETRTEGREVVERALAHTIRDKAEAAYARSDLLEKRRPLMEAWGQWCLREPAAAEVRSLAAAHTKRSREAAAGRQTRPERVTHRAATLEGHRDHRGHGRGDSAAVARMLSARLG
jgi:hypothetical protein